MSVNTLKTKLTWEKKKLATNEWSAGQQNIIRKIKTLEDIINRKGGMFCGCGRPLHGRGLCINCYSRWHYYAHPKHRNNIKSKEKRREIASFGGRCCPDDERPRGCAGRCTQRGGSTHRAPAAPRPAGWTLARCGFCAASSRARPARWRCG